MNLTAVTGLAVAVAFLAAMLRKYHPEYALAVTLAAGAVILIMVLTQVAPVITRLNALLSAAEGAQEYGAVLFKALGVCLLTQLAADACRDAGENGLAEKASLAGKVCLLLMALPLFEKVASLVTGLIGGGAAS